MKDEETGEIFAIYIGQTSICKKHLLEALELSLSDSGAAGVFGHG